MQAKATPIRTANPDDALGFKHPKQFPQGPFGICEAFQHREIKLSVKDTGIGFDLTTLPDIFEIFSQVTRAI